jgi:phage-related minor tail protein
MSLSTEIAFGIIKAIAILFGGSLALIVAYAVFKSLFDGFGEFIEDMGGVFKDLLSWLLNHWKAAIGFVAYFCGILVMLKISEPIAILMWIGLIVGVILLHKHHKKQEELKRKKDAEDFARGHKEKN